MSVTIAGVVVTADFARNVLTTALEAGPVHGMLYWGDVRDVEYNDANEVVAFTAIEHEAYDAKTPARTVRVTLADVQPAILKLLSGPKAGSYAARIFGDEMDGPLAEEIVQVICFGDVLYG